MVAQKYEILYRQRCVVDRKLNPLREAAANHWQGGRVDIKIFANIPT